MNNENNNKGARDKKILHGGRIGCMANCMNCFQNPFREYFYNLWQNQNPFLSASYKKNFGNNLEGNSHQDQNELLE